MRSFEKLEKKSRSEYHNQTGKKTFIFFQKTYPFFHNNSIFQFHYMNHIRNSTLLLLESEIEKKQDLDA